MKATDAQQLSAFPDRELQRRVRAAFILRGTTLAEWCAGNRVSRQFVYQALVGKRHGPTAKALRDQILSAVNLR